MYYSDIVIETHGETTTLYAYNKPVCGDEPLFSVEVGEVFINGVKTHTTQQFTIGGSHDVSLDLRSPAGGGADPDAMITIDK